MKREIKFRAWCKKDEMMYVDVHLGIDFEDNSRYGFKNFVSGWQEEDDYHQWELMQYTGLKDKNGKEIYEGDVIHSPEAIVIDSPKLDWEVKWERHYWTPFNKWGLYEFEIIGNIYENPELLN